MRTRRHKLQVSTFPFLAVLLCAMGALLLVLLVMDRRAHDAARARVAQAARRAAEEAGRAAEARRAEADQRRQQAHDERLREREAAHGRLADQDADLRKQIQLVRDEMVRAAERLRAEQEGEAELKRKVEAEQAQAADEERALASARAEQAARAAESESARKAKEQMTAALVRLEKNLADLKEARKREANTYSVVPYNGKRGENRRPLYVECAAGQVIFHPDHVPLAEPFGAAQVEAEVSRRLTHQKERLPPAQAAAFAPYLLLLVRPDGVSTYYRFREALHGSKIDFGYEFVDKDWVLDFPDADRDAPPPSWVTAAKPSDAAPPPPSADAAAHRLHGVEPSPESGGSAGASNPAAGAPGLPPPLPPPAHATAGAAGTGENGGGEGNAPGLALGPPSPPAGPGRGDAAGPSGAPAVGSDAKGGGPDMGPGGPGLIAPPDAAAGVGLAPPSGSVPSGPLASDKSAQASTGPTDAPKGVGPGRPSGPPASEAPVPSAAGKAAQAAADPQTAPPLLIPPPAPERPAAPSGSAKAPPKGGDHGAWATQGSHGASAADQSASARQADAAKNPASAARTAAGGGGAPAEGGEVDPFLRTPPAPLPEKTHQAITMRPARLGGDRDWILYVECKPEGVVIYPTQTLVPLAALKRPEGNNPLLQTIQQLIDRKQATVRRGEMPYRPEVRFLVRGDAERTYHLAYPLLDALAAPKTSQNLGPDDDVSAVIAGH